LSYGRIDVRFGVLVVLVFHHRRSRSVGCRFDQKIRNISVIPRDRAVNGNSPQSVNQQIIQMFLKDR
jgi:hypothetical protein